MNRIQTIIKYEYKYNGSIKDKDDESEIMYVMNVQAFVFRANFGRNAALFKYDAIFLLLRSCFRLTAKYSSLMFKRLQNPISPHGDASTGAQLKVFSRAVGKEAPPAPFLLFVANPTPSPQAKGPLK